MHACLISSLSHVQLFAALWTVARQAPLSMEFSRQEYWSGLPHPPPGDLLDPEIRLISFMSPELASSENGGFQKSSSLPVEIEERIFVHYKWDENLDSK